MIVVGMSGGVDSSVAALLLKQAGHEVVGLFMKNWDERDERGQCTAERDYRDVVATCAKLDIPCHSVDFVQDYWKLVFEEFLADLRQGLTPNPDILCNRHIKFDLFLKYALSLGASHLATGHYCRTGNGQLLKGADDQKDQSYFLAAVNGQALGQVLFPLGEMTKAEVRRVAVEHGLPTHAKKDSTGICFIGERNFSRFVGQYLPYKRGEFRTLDEHIVGEHLGVAYYTIGQRRHLGLGGAGDRWYVVAKDIGRNVIYVHRGEHPIMFKKFALVTDLHSIDSNLPITVARQCKARYRQADQACRVLDHGDPDHAVVEFTVPQKGVASGQRIVFYQNDICLGSAKIVRAGDQIDGLSSAPVTTYSSPESKQA